MKLNRKYRIIIEDEATLEKKFNVSAKTHVFLIGALALFISSAVVAVFFLAFSPLRNLLPGYLNKTEREATEEQHLRLDSLLRIYEVNEMYLSGILNALEPTLPDSSILTSNGTEFLPIDSLPSISKEEKEFIETIRERDKYNIAVASQADAETLMFGNINRYAVISEKSKDLYQAEVIIPLGSQVEAVAEGKVISIASSPKTAGGYEVIIQHPKGFLSKSSRLANLLVSAGERVAQGQIIGSTSSKSGRKSETVMFELWHDGNPLKPARYLRGNKE